MPSMCSKTSRPQLLLKPPTNQRASRMMNKLIRALHETVSSGAKQVRLLYMFSGEERSGSFEEEAAELGNRLGIPVIVGSYEVKRSPEGDLVDDEVWRKLEAKLKRR